MTAPTCHDLAEMIESDPATVWTWGGPLGGLHSLPPHNRTPVTPWPDHNRREKTYPPLATLEADQ